MVVSATATTAVSLLAKDIYTSHQATKNPACFPNLSPTVSKVEWDKHCGYFVDILCIVGSSFPMLLGIQDSNHILYNCRNPDVNSAHLKQGTSGDVSF